MSILEYLQEKLDGDDKPDYWFRYATPEDVVDLIKKKHSIISMDNFKYVDTPDDFIDISEVRKLNGFFGEKRKYRIDRDNNLAMFGNYTMKQWYEFLLSIATTGLREPVLLSPNGTEIIEGNHRVQALHQLGYKQVPVIYDRK